MTAERKDTWAAGKLYEPYVGRWSRLVAKEFLGWVGTPPNLDWLDVGCGTGALTEAILQHAKPSSVKGMDPSAGYIEHAKAHITKTIRDRPPFPTIRDRPPFPAREFSQDRIEGRVPGGYPSSAVLVYRAPRAA